MRQRIKKYGKKEKRKTSIRKDKFKLLKSFRIFFFINKLKLRKKFKYFKIFFLLIYKYSLPIMKISLFLFFMNKYLQKMPR